MWSFWLEKLARYRLITCLLMLLLCVQTAWGQLPKAASPSKPSTQPAAAEAPSDPLGRTTPRGTVLGFLTAAYGQKYDAAAQYLDTRARGNEAAVLASQLFFVLDRKLPAKLNNISDDPFGSMSDRVNSRRELIGSVVTDRGGVDVYVERVDRPNGTPIWLFSRETLVDIPGVYDEINSTTVERRIPEFMLKKYFGIGLFGWTYLCIFLPVLYLLLSLLNRLVGAGLRWAIHRWTRCKSVGKFNILPHPLRIFILSCTVFSTLRQVSFSLVARQAGSTVGDLLLIVALVWAVFLVNARGEVFLQRRMERQGRISTTAVLRPARRALDLLAVIVGVVCVLRTLGINPTATLAGLGVGGIAIALGAQKTLENIIGGVSLIADGAVRVGDLFKIGEVEGFVEGIGLRSTRLRTHDRTVVTIPNAQMATMTLENLSARDRFWLHHHINIEYDTSPSKLDSLLKEVRSFLERDARILPEVIRVRILTFAESRLELEVWAYITAQNWAEFLQIQEDLLIKIRQIIASAGVALAHPSRTVYVKSGSDGDGERMHTAVPEKEAGHEMQMR